MDVSIIICTRDRAASLPGTLMSLAAIRTGWDWEAIILDNGSSDDTARVIRAADDCGGRLRYAYEGQPGLGAARDSAWRLARGRICAFTDDDCYVEPDYVDAIVRAFEEHPEAGCIGGRIMLFDPADAPVTIDEREIPEDIPPRIFIAAGVLHGANLSLRRSVLEEIDGFDRRLGAGTPFPSEDVDVYARAAWAGHGLRFDPRPVVHHHHGRKEADLPRLFIGYDRGRGAYYAKFLLNPQTRRTYRQGWWAIATGYRAAYGPRRIRCEVGAGLRYLAARRAYGFMLWFALFGAAAYLTARWNVLRAEG